MLDIGAPVSPLVIREMIVDDPAERAAGAAGLPGCPPLLRPVARGRPARAAPPPPAAARGRPARPARARRSRALMYLDDDRRPTLTPQLALRVAILGGVALVMFAIVFFRLWYLQVLSGDHYLAEANDNRVREIKVAGAARRDRRPQRPRAGRQPLGAGGRDRARQAARRPAERHAALQAPRRACSACAGARSSRRARQLRRCRSRRRSSRPTSPLDVVDLCPGARTTFPGVTVEQVFLR